MSHMIARTRVTLFIASFITIGASNAFGQSTTGQSRVSTEALMGAWDGPYCWPRSTHQLHLPPSGDSSTGRVLMWPGPIGEFFREKLWNPQPGCFGDFNDLGPECVRDVPIDETILFCAGHTALADGTIFTAGGHYPPSGVGVVDTNHFIRDPFDGEWGVWKTFEDGMPEMVERRWYPTVTTLPDGRALVVSGSSARCNGGVRDGERCSQNPTSAHSCDVCVGGANEGDPCTEDGMCEGGTCDTDGTCERFIIKIPEIYDPAADSPGLTQLMDVETDIPFYPFIFVLPDGTVLYAGSEASVLWEGGGNPSVLATETYVLDVNAEPVTWTQKGDSSITGGSAVMFEPGKVLKSGGNRPAVAGAAVYDWTAGTWTDVAPMHYARLRHQLTLLPDGTVLATGGTRSAPVGVCVGGNNNGDPCADDIECDEGRCLEHVERHNREYASSCDGGKRHGLECSSGPPLLPNCAGNTDQGCPGGNCVPGEQLWVATAEIYDPDSDTWIEMAEAMHPRLYHSSALLLPDGRVLSAGGFGGAAINLYPTVEFFSPPYYFKERPEITSAPSAIYYSSTFQMTSPNAVDISRITLVRLGTTTHSFDSDQRFLELTIARQAANQLNVVAPENGNVAPPGYYMLFVLTEDEQGKDVPSVGEYVRLAQDPCADDDGDGRVTICHIPPGNPDNAHTITVSVNAVPAHLAHGDHCGACGGDDALLMRKGSYAYHDRCPRDLDDSESVGPLDLALLLNAWGPSFGHPADFNGDGVVNAFDLAQLLGAWGLCT